MVALFKVESLVKDIEEVEVEVEGVEEERDFKSLLIVIG